jgi:hypothetical protein
VVAEEAVEGRIVDERPQEPQEVERLELQV